MAEPVNFFFIPVIRLQNEERRDAALSLFAACSFDTGGFKLWPSAFADARPLAFKPPSGFFPADRCQAGLFAIYTPKEKNGAEAPLVLSSEKLSRAAFRF